MYLCYIDESGNTGKNLKDTKQPYLVLTALLVPSENIKQIETDINSLSQKYFPDSFQNIDFELRADSICNGRGNYFKQISLARRFELLDEIIDIALKHESIKIGYISIEKSQYYANQHIQQTAFSLLVEKLEERLCGYLNSYCLLIADEQHELEQDLINDLDRFKRKGTEFGYNRIKVDRIIDSLHFVKSRNNYLMQLTDIMCYVIRRGNESSRKLIDAYHADSKNNQTLPYKDWVESHGNNGQKYFHNTIRRINSKKAWIFSKDFP